jgi:hypothetical protein
MGAVCPARSSSALLIVAVMAAAPLAGSCRIATTYVPRTPGKATIGIERGRIGVYKDGVFTKLADEVPRSLACSPPALAAATSAAAHARSSDRNAAIASVTSPLAVLLLPLVAISLTFSAISERHRRESFALAVDAVNRNNDTVACVPAAAPARGAQP